MSSKLTIIDSVLLLAIGALLPYLFQQFNRTIKAKNYKIAQSVIGEIELDILNRTGGGLLLTEAIYLAVARKDYSLKHEQINNIVHLILKSFDFCKAIKKEAVYSTLEIIHHAQERIEETDSIPETENN